LFIIIVDDSGMREGETLTFAILAESYSFLFDLSPSISGHPIELVLSVLPNVLFGRFEQLSRSEEVRSRRLMGWSSTWTVKMDDGRSGGGVDTTTVRRGRLLALDQDRPRSGPVGRPSSCLLGQVL
jgi:hypothetical protein